VERIVKTPIDARSTIARIERDEAGAILTFAGTVRNRHRGRDVIAIDYHAYESMAARELEKLEREIESRWPEIRAAIVHRIGYLELGEASVLIAVSSPHRADGFDALRYAIDELKKRAPIWKKELYRDGGSVWLEGS
jgi:molybdopterin synthase catalytic subunit